jgi:hypothetical protein
MHPALRDTNLTGDEIRPLMLVGDQRYRVFAPDWHRLGKRLLTMTTTGQKPAPSNLPERRLITNGGTAGRDLQWLRRTTQAQRPGAREATIATATLPPG